MNLRFKNLGFISKRKIAKLLDKCERNSGVHEDGSYTVPPTSNEFYFDMGEQAIITHLRTQLHIGKARRNNEHS